MKIELCRATDTPFVFKIFEERRLSMDIQGIFQWTEHYPRQRTIEDDIAQGHLYTISENHVLAGAIILNMDQDPQYRNINWRDTDRPSLIIHRLAIHPSQQNKGFAKALMRFAEEYATLAKFNSIRLDAYSENPVAVNLYPKLGCEKRGQLFFRNITSPFFCFEKVLARN